MKRSISLKATLRSLPINRIIGDEFDKTYQQPDKGKEMIQFLVSWSINVNAYCQSLLVVRKLH